MPENAKSPTDDTRKRLEKAAEGLLFISETDAPFQYVELPGATELTPDAIRAALGEPETTPVSERTLDKFLAGHIEKADPADPVAQANVKDFQALKKALRKELEGVTVFRVGDVQLRYYIVGTTPEGTVAGLVTEAVET